jgi:hypothetical protein
MQAHIPAMGVSHRWLHLRKGEGGEFLAALAPSKQTPRGWAVVSCPPWPRVWLQVTHEACATRRGPWKFLKIDLACDRKDTTYIRQKPHAGVIKGKLPS